MEPTVKGNVRVGRQEAGCLGRWNNLLQLAVGGWDMGFIGRKPGKGITFEMQIKIINKSDYMKFLGNWMHLENIILSEVMHSQKNIHGMPSLFRY